MLVLDAVFIGHCVKNVVQPQEQGFSLPCFGIIFCGLRQSLQKYVSLGTVLGSAESVVYIFSIPKAITSRR